MQFDLTEIDRLLTTTRAVRRRLDFERPVEDDVLFDSLEVALQAPNGSNRQRWRWLIVRHPDRKKAIAELCREASGDLGERLIEEARAKQDDDAERLYVSAVHLIQNLEKVPVFVIPCVAERPEHFVDLPQMVATNLYGSIFPAIWNFQLALHSRGLGSSVTTLHLAREKQIADILRIPEDVTQVALLPVAYIRGSGFRRAPRRPLQEVAFSETWGTPIPTP